MIGPKIISYLGAPIIFVATCKSGMFNNTRRQVSFETDFILEKQSPL